MKTAMETIQLEQLLGLHSLDAADFGSESIDRYGTKEQCNALSFRLNGTVYTAVEDPGDGYRSALAGLFLDHREMKNTFPAVQVLARKKANGEWGNDTLQLVDTQTGRMVLEVGTDNSDDYYPCCILTFMPQNMVTNLSVNDLATT